MTTCESLTDGPGLVADDNDLIIKYPDVIAQTGAAYDDERQNYKIVITIWIFTLST